MVVTTCIEVFGLGGGGVVKVPVPPPTPSSCPPGPPPKLLVPVPSPTVAPLPAVPAWVLVWASTPTDRQRAAAMTRNSRFILCLTTNSSLQRHGHPLEVRKERSNLN